MTNVEKNSSYYVAASEKQWGDRADIESSVALQLSITVTMD